MEYTSVELDREIEFTGKVVRHYKGDLYLVLDMNVEHTETGEKLVYYKALYGNFKTYIRPKSMFLEACNFKQYATYGQKYRFEEIKIASNKKED